MPGTLKGQNSKKSEFGVKKDLLIEKALTKKMGGLVVPQTHLLKVQNSGFFYLKERVNGRGKRRLPTADIWATLGVQGRWC